MSLQTGFNIKRSLKDSLSFTETNVFLDSGTGGSSAGGTGTPNATINWSSVSGGSSYVAMLGSGSTQNYTTSYSTTGTSMKFTGLTEGQLYVAAVYAVDGSGHTGILSNEVNWRMPRTGQLKYVSTLGTSGAAGTLADPWSQSKAFASASAGDTVYFRAGTYSVSSPTISLSGTANNVITFTNYPGETAILNGTQAGGGVITLSGARYVRVQGLKVTTTASTASRGIYVAGEGSHLEIDSNECYSLSQSGIWVEGNASTAANSFITNNVCHDSGSGGLTLWVFDAGYWRVEGNECYNAGAVGNYDGLQIGGGSGGGNHIIIRNNYCHDNNLSAIGGADQLDIGGHALCHHYLSEGNLVYPHNGSGVYKLNSGSFDTTWVTGISGFCISRFNICVGNMIDSYEYPNTVCHYNNTFYNPGTFIQHYWNNISTVSLGDGTWAPWKAANGLSDSDTGRMNVKNNLVINNAASTAYMVFENDNPPAGKAVLVDYGSVRYQNNIYQINGTNKVNWGSFNSSAFDTNFNSYKTSNSPNLPDTNSTKYATGAAISTIFRDATNFDFQPANSSCLQVGRAATLTSAIGSGTSTSVLICDRASYFFDGYPNPTTGEYLGMPDTIQIGSGTPVAISSIGEGTAALTFNTINLAAPRTWSSGDPVKLYNKGYDVGAIDSLPGGVARPVKTQNVVVTSISLT